MMALGILLLLTACTPKDRMTSVNDDALYWEDVHPYHTEFPVALADQRLGVSLFQTAAPFGLHVMVSNHAPVSRETPSRPAIDKIRLYDGVKRLIDMEIFQDARYYSFDLPETPRSLRMEFTLGTGTVLHKIVHISPALKLRSERYQYFAGDPRTLISKASSSGETFRAAFLCLPHPGDGEIEQMEIIRVDTPRGANGPSESLVMRFVPAQPFSNFRAVIHDLRTNAETAAALGDVKFKFTCRTSHRRIEAVNAVESAK